jgi:hypothetical protein
VVHVRVGHNYVAYLLTLLGRKRQRNAATINSNTLVDEKTCQTLIGGCVALTIKGAW